MKPSNIKIILADAQLLIRVGLRHLLDGQEGLEIIGEAAREKELMDLLKAERPDILIMDHQQSGRFSKDTLDKVKKTAPDTNVLIISADNDQDHIFQVLNKGVNSFLTKQCDKEEIINAVRATAKGEKFFCNKILNYLLERSLGQEPPPARDELADSPLSVRELEIVRLVTSGKIAKEIAEELNLSTHTVYTHRKNIMKKLKLRSASELVRYAIQHGLLETSSRS